MGLLSFLNKPVVSPILGRTKATLGVLPQWKIIAESSTPTPLYTKDARYVNLWVNNKVKYVGENVDKWSHPSETWQKREGDCEDFAILKYYSIEPTIEKYLAVGMLNDGRCHCVLLAKVGDWIVLDCMRNEMLSWKEYQKMFKPVYLFNKDGVWI